MTTDPLVGALIGRYRVERAIGRGGMGRVYLGVHPEIGSRVAIKVLADEWADSPDLLDRFFAEAHTVNLIRHENIITVLDLDRMPNGRPFIVMEYIAGRSLRDVVDAGPAPLGGVVHVMIEVLLALAAAHAAGVVHRDLKPDNVMVTAAGRTKVLDFGIAKLVAAGPRTRTGSSLGTPEYMAPEQILGERVDARADLYAAGVMLYELCTGTRPFAGTTDYQLMEGHLRGVVPSARAARADVPDALDAVIAQALAKRPDERFQSATAMANALRAASSALAPSAWQPLVADSAAVSFDALPIATERDAAASDAAATVDARPSGLIAAGSPAPSPRDAREGRLDERTRTAPRRPSAPEPAAPVRESANAPTVRSGPGGEVEAAPRTDAARRGSLTRVAIVVAGTLAIGTGALVVPRLVRDGAAEDAGIVARPSDAQDVPQIASGFVPTGADTGDAGVVVAVGDAGVMSDRDAGAIALVDAGALVAMRDAGALVAMRDAGAHRDAAVTAVAGAPRDAATTAITVAPRDAAVVATLERDASTTVTKAAHGPSDHTGWRPDPVWGFDPPIKTGKTGHSQTFDHELGTDAATFDIGTYAAIALHLARELEPDAVLTGFDTFLDRDGHLSKSKRSDTLYGRMWFRSPAAAAANDPGRLACIYVFPGYGGASVERVDHCDPEPAVQLPRCTVAAVLAKATRADSTAQIYVNYRGSWRVTQWQQGDDESDRRLEQKRSQKLADDCN